MSPLDIDARSFVVLTSDERVAGFFREELDDLQRSQNSDSLPPPTPALSTVRNRTSAFNIVRQSLNRFSKDSINLQGRQLFTLNEFCEFIQSHSSLETALIVSCSCYTEPTAIRFIPHRFLILQLYRKGRPDVWLRLDRRPSSNVGLFGLAFAGGVTPSNDAAMLASSPDKLLILSHDANEESRLAFGSPCPLSKLRLRLLDIILVMGQYKLTSENCWAFCSLLLSYFKEEDNAEFRLGRLRFSNLAREAKQLLSIIEEERRARLPLEAKRQLVMQQLAPVLSLHNPSKFIPFSTQLHELGSAATSGLWREGVDKVAEAARCWEDFDGFSSPEGQHLAGRLVFALGVFEASVSAIYPNPESQLALQTTALCRQVALCAKASGGELDPDVSDRCFYLFNEHGRWYLRNTPPYPHKALPLFEAATTLLVPGITENWLVFSLRYYHAMALHETGRVDEARAIVVGFIECVRHHWNLSPLYGHMKDLQTRGIWPEKFNYLFDLAQGDLPYWTYWHQDPAKSHNSVHSRPSKTRPRSTILSISSERPSSQPSSPLAFHPHTPIWPSPTSASQNSLDENLSKMSDKRAAGNDVPPMLKDIQRVGLDMT